MEFDVTTTFTVRVQAESAADAQAAVGDLIRATFTEGHDIGAISAMDTIRVGQ